MSRAARVRPAGRGPAGPPAPGSPAEARAGRGRGSPGPRARARETQARRLSTEALGRLGDRTGPVGAVHSAYRRTINVELATGALISLHGPGDVASPFGIECGDSGPAGRCRTGEPVYRDASGLWLPDSGVRVRLAGAATWNPEVCASRGAVPVPLLRALAGAGGPCGGLLPLLPLLLGDETERSAGLSPLGAGALAALRAMEAGLLGRSSELVVRAAARLIGMGVGLTPSGDDALIGWLTAVRTAGPGERALLDGCAPSLAAAAASGTTRLSRELIACALRGRVAEPLQRFAARPTPEALAALLSCGATSGGDGLAGWVAGRLASPDGGGGPAPETRRPADGRAPA